MKTTCLSTLALAALLEACGGGTSQATPTATPPTATAPAAASGGETASVTSTGSLTRVGTGNPRSVGGPIDAAYADMTRWDPDQGRLVAYFGTGTEGVGVTLNLGAPFAVGERDLRTGPVVFEVGESFEERVDVSDAHLVIESLDVAARTMRLRIEGHTTVDAGGLPEAFAFEATVVVPPGSP